MPGMTLETAKAWMNLNHAEFKRLVEIGYLPAVKVQRAWWEAKAARDASNGDFERLRDYWLDVFNEFLVFELSRTGRADLHGHGYKLGDVGLADLSRK